MNPPSIKHHSSLPVTHLHQPCHIQLFGDLSAAAPRDEAAPLPVARSAEAAPQAHAAAQARDGRASRSACRPLAPKNGWERMAAAPLVCFAAVGLTATVGCGQGRCGQGPRAPQWARQTRVVAARLGGLEAPSSAAFVAWEPPAGAQAVAGMASRRAWATSPQSSLLRHGGWTEERRDCEGSRAGSAAAAPQRASRAAAEPHQPARLASRRPEAARRRRGRGRGRTSRWERRTTHATAAGSRAGRDPEACRRPSRDGERTGPRSTGTPAAWRSQRSSR